MLKRKLVNFLYLYFDSNNVCTKEKNCSLELNWLTVLKRLKIFEVVKFSEGFVDVSRLMLLLMMKNPYAVTNKIVFFFS